MEHFVDQSAKDIRYYLFEGPVDMSQFTIMDEQTFKWNDHKVHMSIIGESHIISVNIGGSVINEICACTEVDIGNQEALEMSHLHVVDEVVEHAFTRPTPAIEYAFKAEYVDWDKGAVNLHKIQSAAANSPDESGEYISTIVHSFPNAKDEKRVPLTLIYVHRTDTIMTVRTIHTYPNEDSMVYTTSTWKLTA